MSTVAELSVLISAKDEATRVLQGVTETLDKSHKAMIAVGGAMTAIGGLGVGAFGAAVHAAQGFESTMAGVKAVMSGPEVAQFGDELERLAKQLGKDTKFSAQEAATGLEELIKAGVKAEDVLSGLGAAATNLAAATGVKIADAAEIMSNMVNAFGVDAADAGRQVDRLAGVVNATAVDMGDFKFALQAGGAAAKLAGVSVDEFTVAVGLMANAGIKGSDSGTSMKTMFNNLIPSSKAEISAFRELGIITNELGNRFFDAAGNAKPLQERMQILQEAIQHLTAEDRTRLVHQAFGTDAMRAAAVFAEAGAAGYAKVNDELEKTTAAEAAKTRMDNLGGSLEQLHGSLETVGIEIGQRLTPYMRGLADAITAALNVFLELPRPVQDTAVAVGVAVTAFLAIGGPLLMLKGALVPLVAAFTAAAPAIAAVAGPVILVGAAVAAFAAAWVNDFGSIRSETERALEHIQPVFDTIGGLLGQLVDGARETASNWIQFFGGMTSATTEGSSAITTAANEVIRWFHDDLAPTLTWAASAWAYTWQSLQIEAISAWNLVQPTLQALRDWFTEHLPPALATVRESWESFWGQVGPTVRLAWEVVQPVLAGIREWLGVHLPPVLQTAGDLWNDFLGGVARFAEVLGPVIGALASTIGGAFSTFNERLQTALTKMRPELADDANAVGAAMAEGMAAGINENTRPITWAAQRAAQKALAAAKAELEISSPSRVMANEVGVPIMQGIALGIRQETAATAAEFARAVGGLVPIGLGRSAPFGMSAPGGGFAIPGQGLGTPNPLGPAPWEGSGKGPGYFANPFAVDVAGAQQATMDWANRGNPVADESIKAALSGEISGAYADTIKELAKGTKEAGKENESASRSVVALGRSAYGLERDAYPAADAVRAVSDVFGAVASSAQTFTGGIAHIGQQLAQNASVYDSYSNVGLAKNTAAFNAMAATQTMPTGGGGSGALGNGDPTTGGYYGPAYSTPNPLAEQWRLQWEAAVAMGTAPGMDNLPHFAAGGIVTQPTLALVGENGPERITPLGRSGGGSGGPTIVVNYSPVMGAATAVEKTRAARELAQLIKSEWRKLGL